MAIDNVQVNNSVGTDGNSFTTSISNDKLTNDDFLRLMLEEMKMQDPTKPMDSQRMLDSQMQMSGIETNLATIEAMKSLQNSFAQTALASASNIIGKIVEDGNLGQSGEPKGYKVAAIESIDGNISVKGYEIIGYDAEAQELILSTEQSTLAYDKITKIY